MTEAPRPLEGSDALRTFGTTQPVPAATVLAAGDLSCEWDGGGVRHVRWRGVEVIRGIAYLLRDTNWGTTPCDLHDLRIEQTEGRFSVGFALRWQTPAGELLATARLEGEASGRLSFVVDAQAQAPLATNRCGFVVLHPASAAQAPLQIEHTDGSVEDTQFPRIISPGQVAFHIRRLRHEPQPGLSVDCLLKAELPHDPVGKFEMEDQRNWSDASFKTYVASLLDPWPYTLPAGLSLSQSVQIAVHDNAAPVPVRASAAQGPAPVQLGAASAQRLPPIGLGVPLGLAAMTPAEADAVVALRPAWLVAEADAGDAPALATQLEHLRTLAARCGAQVQLDVICPAHAAPAHIAASVAAACERAGLPVGAVRACPTPYLKSYQPSDRWPDLQPLETYAQAFADRFPQARIGGGMLTYFTELNRKRQSAEALHFVGHSTCPLVHAADDVSVMQTHESLASIHASVRALWPTLGYRLGPITLAMHRNPYGERTAANPARERLAMADADPRHQAAYGAAWLAAYAAAVQGFDLELLTLQHSHGRSGPLLDAHMPGWRPGACVPAWRVQGVLARAAGCALHPLTGLPAGMTGLAWAVAPGGVAQALLVNLTAAPRRVCLPGAWRAVDLSTPCDTDALTRPSLLPGETSPEAGGDPGTRFDLHDYQVLWLHGSPDFSRQ